MGQILTAVDEAKSSGKSERSVAGIGLGGVVGSWFGVKLENEGRAGAVEQPRNVLEAAAEQTRPGRVLGHSPRAGLQMQKKLEEVAPGTAES